VIAAKAHQCANAVPYSAVSCPKISTCSNVVFWCMCKRCWNKIVLYGHQIMYKILIELNGSSVNLLSGCLDFKKLSYMERLHLLYLPSLELRRLHIHLIWCYKIIFGIVHINCEEFCSFQQKIHSRSLLQAPQTDQPFFRPHRSTTHVDAAYCYRPSSVVCLSVCRSVCLVCHTSGSCKNDCTDRDAV